MRLPGYKTIKRAAAWLNSRFQAGALILGYHRIADTARDPYSLCISPEHFAEQLDVIRRSMTPVSLTDLVDAIRTGTAPHHAVAVTFDDGYVDNLQSAQPLLERYDIPATVFVVAGHLGREFWWDQVARVIYSASTLLDELVFTVGERRYHGNILCGCKPGKRDGLIVDLYRRLRPLSAKHKSALLAQLSDWAGVPLDAETSARTLHSDELIALASSELIEVGSHSLTHPTMTMISQQSVKTELKRSKARLEDILARPIAKFSYPDGGKSRAIQAEVASAGYRSACSSRYDVAMRSSNVFDLPRIWPLDWDGEKFERWIRRWANG